MEATMACNDCGNIKCSMKGGSGLVHDDPIYFECMGQHRKHWQPSTGKAPIPEDLMIKERPWVLQR